MVRKGIPLVLALALAGCREEAAPSATGPRAEEQGEPAALVRKFPASPTGGFRQGANSILKDAKAWEAAWATGNAARTPAPKAPHVDFEKEMVALAALGPKTTSGWAVQVVSARVFEGKLRVLFSVREPSEEEAATKASLSPWHAVVLAKSDLPVEWLRYEPPKPEPRRKK